MKQPPTKLSDVTLGQWVGYQNAYGQALDDRLLAISKMNAGQDREDTYLLYDADYHLQNYAYYTGTPLEEVMQMNPLDVCKLQGAAFVALKKEAVLLDWRAIFTWNGHKWKIQPVFPATDKLTKPQFDIVTDIALIWSDLQDGKHEALYELCAVYLRHPDEEYTSELMEIRKRAMQDLPLSIALCVKMYNEISVKKLLKTR